VRLPHSTKSLPGGEWVVRDDGTIGGCATFGHMHHTTVAALVRRGHCVGCGCTGRTDGAATALSVLRRAHDHHRNLPTLDAAARAAGFSRINRDEDAVTRHGPYLLRRVVASPHRPSPSDAPGDTPAPSITSIPHVIADFAHPRHRSSALIGRHNCWSGGPGQPSEHHAGNPQHTQLLKSP
jgi:hypothetical protein